MQGFCLFSVVQFHLMINAIIFGFLIFEANSNPQYVYLMVIGAFQFLSSLALLISVFIRPRHIVKKGYIYSIALFEFIISAALISLHYSNVFLLFNIVSLLSLSLLTSFLAIPKQYIAVGIIIQIYIIGSVLNMNSLYLWHQELFSLSRAIAIMGANFFGLLTLACYLFGHIRKNCVIQEELHLIIGFYCFCEIFVVCMFIVEANINNESSESYINLPIIYSILKFSNFGLDILVYPFAKLQVKEQVTITQVLPDRGTLTNKFESYAITTKDTESECSSATKIIYEKQKNQAPKQENTSSLWIQYLLKIY